MRYTTRPLSDRTWLRPAGSRQRARFDTTWTKTLNLLGREIDHLGGRDVVIEVDVREQDIRRDGMLRANASAESPAVVVAFDTHDHGPMLYRCDRYLHTWSNRPGWQENVRAVALTLEALRAVDRYGAMPASHMTETEDTSQRTSSACGPCASGRRRTRRTAGRSLCARAHPDRHDGDRTLWDQVEQAAQVLGVAR